jgi:pSer/pThr/pTyr-binding forkhead associated (FHA) protein
MELVLVMFTDKEERRDFPVKSKKATIGRNTECSLQIPLGMVSRRHCEIRVKGGEVTVRDLGSSNGTYVNNKRVQEAELEAGDTLTVGPVIFTVVIDGEPEEILPIRTVVEKAKKEKKSKPSPKPMPSAPKNPDDTGSIDLEDSSASLDLELEEEGEQAGPANPLSELEALSRQKKS